MNTTPLLSVPVAQVYEQRSVWPRQVLTPRAYRNCFLREVTPLLRKEASMLRSESMPSFLKSMQVDHVLTESLT